MTRMDPRLFWWAAGGFVLAVLGANAQLAYLAFASQPDCVAHVRAGQGSAEFGAAVSSCQSYRQEVADDWNTRR